MRAKHDIPDVMRRHTSWFLSIVLCTCTASAGAQPTPDAALVGTVHDATDAVIAGATVDVSGSQLIGRARTVVTDREGSWRAPVLPPGVYTVRVSARGFRTAERGGVRLVAGTTLTVDVELDLAEIAETARVEAPAVIVDVTSAAVPVNIDEPVLVNVPTSRSIADLINLVPGVAGQTAFGGTTRTNAIYVDGVDTTDPLEQDPWLRYSQNWLQEVQVVGLGADAEHGKFTGVAAYAIVRSGANAFTGLGEYWTVPSAWVANNTKALSESLQQSFASERIDANWNANGQVGGPVRRDRLWFFAGVDHTTNNRAPAGYSGPEAVRDSDFNLIAKFTAAAWRGTRLEGFVQAGRDRIENWPLGPGVALDATGLVTNPQVSWSVRGLAGVGRSVILDVRYTGYDSSTEYAPQPPQSNEGPPAHIDNLTFEHWGNFAYPGRDERVRHGLTLAGTWYGSGGRGGAHELKVGLEADGSSIRSEEWYPGGILYLDYGGVPDLVYRWDGGISTGTSFHTAFFVQDRWSAFRRLTLLPGLRVDAFRGSIPEQRNIFATTPVSPRLGIAWDVRGDHRSVLRAHYGRYTDPGFSLVWFVLDDSGTSPRVTERYVAPGVFEVIPPGPPGLGRSIDPDIKQSHVDQFVLGAEQQFFSNLSLQVQYIHRRFDDFMAYLREGPTWVPVERRDPGPDGREGTADDGPLVTVFSSPDRNLFPAVYTNADEKWRRYHAVQATARKRFADRWQLQASYTWSRTTGTMRNGYHANSGVGRVTGAGDPNFLINGKANVEFDPTHEMKVLGSWNPSWLGGFVLGGVYRYMSGSPWGRTFVARGLGQGSATVLAEPRGTRRVAAINNLDLRVEKLAPLGAGRQLGMFVDVFNVSNQGVPDSDWVTPVITSSGPNLGVPVAWRHPRMVRAAVRVTF